MALQPIVSSQDGPRLTVNDLVKAPTVIPRRLLNMMNQRFMMDSLLRRGGNAPGGAVMYWPESPLFADGDPAIVEEFGEYPIVGSQEGTPELAYTLRRGMGMLVSEDQRRRNQLDRVKRRMTQLRNTFVRSYDKLFFNAIDAGATTLAAGSTGAGSTGPAWNTSEEVRIDIAEAIRMITEAQDSSNQDSYLGYIPDTMILHSTMVADLMGNDEFNKIFQGNIADENLQYVGKLPNKVFGLNVVHSFWTDPTAAYVLERGTIGFVSDERPLQAQPMHYDPDRETWRSNISRISAVVIDNPKAAVKITGVAA